MAKPRLQIAATGTCPKMFWNVPLVYCEVRLMKLIGMCSLVCFEFNNLYHEFGKGGGDFLKRKCKPIKT